MKFKQYLLEKAKIIGMMDLPVMDDEVTQRDLKSLEIVLDRLFKSLGLDIEFTRHFHDRVNDHRNKKQITVAELQQIYSKTYAKFGKQLANLKNDTQGVLDDMQDNINIPFILKWDKKKNMVDLIAKTVMRKKGFKSKDRIFKV